MSTSGSDRLRENLRRYIEAGVALGKANSKEIESTVRDLFDRDFPSRERLEDSLEELRARSRRGIDLIIELVRSEVRREIDAAARRRREEIVDLFERGVGLFEELLGRRQHPRDHDGHNHDGHNHEVPAHEANEPSVPVKKTAAKKVAAKKTTANKVAAKKTTPTKVAAKKRPVKKAAPSRSSSPSDESRD